MLDYEVEGTPAEVVERALSLHYASAVVQSSQVREAVAAARGRIPVSARISCCRSDLVDEICYAVSSGASEVDVDVPPGSDSLVLRAMRAAAGNAALKIRLPRDLWDEALETGVNYVVVDLTDDVDGTLALAALQDKDPRLGVKALVSTPAAAEAALSAGATRLGTSDPSLLTAAFSSLHATDDKHGPDVQI